MNLTRKDIMNLVDFTPFSVSGNELVSSVIYQAIRCKTHPTLPRKIDIIADKVKDLYLREFEKITDIFYLKTFSDYDKTLNWLKENLLAIPEIQELNLSQKEFDAGIGVDDECRDLYAFTSAYSSDQDDFVDLDAFVRNICHQIIRSNININFSTFTFRRD